MTLYTGWRRLPPVSARGAGPDLPIRHPEAQRALAMMEEHRERQEKLLALWQAAHEWHVHGFRREYAEYMRLIDAILALGPPPA